MRAMPSVPPEKIGDFQPKWAEDIKENGPIELDDFGRQAYEMAAVTEVIGWEAARDLYQIRISELEVVAFREALFMCVNTFQVIQNDQIQRESMRSGRYSGTRT